MSAENTDPTKMQMKALASFGRSFIFECNGETGRFYNDGDKVWNGRVTYQGNPIDGQNVRFAVHHCKGNYQYERDGVQVEVLFKEQLVVEDAPQD